MDTEETYAHLVLAPLSDAQPSRPSTVDIRRAIATGRRRRRLRQLGGVAAGAGAVAVVLVGVSTAGAALRHATPPATAASRAPSVAASTGPSAAASPVPSPTVAPDPPPPAPAACTVERLPLPKGQTMSLVTAADRTGHYITGRSYPDPGSARPVLIWHDGQPRVVDVPGEDQSFHDITSSGDAVGVSFLDKGMTAFVYWKGHLAELPGADAEARALNAHGVVVGKSQGRPVVWRTPTSQPEPLPTPTAGAQGEAYGIDDDGTIVGTLSSGGQEYGYVWSPDGSVHQLPSPVVDGVAATMSRAFGLHDGWATGLAANPASGSPSAAAVRWNVRTGEVRVVAQLAGPIEGNNRYGWVVGSDPAGHAALVAGAATVTLPGLNPDVQPLDSIAYTVSEDGRTVAGQSVLNDNARTIVAVVWHCH
jgi:hypothetical protein